MFKLFEIIAFIIIPIIALSLSFLLGWKRNIFQSGSKLILTFLAILISTIIVNVSVIPVLQNNLHLLNNLVGNEMFAYLSTASITDDVVNLISCLIMPFVFGVVFALICIIFALLYLIPGRLLSNKALSKRVKKTDGQSNPSTATVSPIDEKCVNILKCRKTWLRAGSVACSMVSTFLVLALLALPLSYYSGAIISLDKTINIEEGTFSDVVDISDSISSHPTNIIYKPFSGVISGTLDHFKTSRGDRVSAIKSVCDSVSFIEAVSAMDLSTLSAQNCYDLADLIELNPYLNCVTSGLVKDMVQSWKNGEPFMGVEPIVVDSSDAAETIYTALSDTEDVPASLRLVGDMLAISYVMQPGGEERVDTLYQVLLNSNSSSTVALKNILSSDAILSVLPSNAYSVLLDSVLTQIVDIKNDKSISEIETSEILYQEAENLIIVLDTVTNPGIVQPEVLINAVVNSKVLASTVVDITENGTVKDPCGIAANLPQQFTGELSSILVNQGVAEGSDFYNAFMALFTTN